MINGAFALSGIFLLTSNNKTNESAIVLCRGNFLCCLVWFRISPIYRSSLGHSTPNDLTLRMFIGKVRLEVNAKVILDGQVLGNLIFKSMEKQ